MKENIIKNADIVAVEFDDNEFATCINNENLIMCKTICGGSGTFIVEETEEVTYCDWTEVSLASKVIGLAPAPSDTLVTKILYDSHMCVLPCGLLIDQCTDDDTRLFTGISTVVEAPYQDWGTDIYWGIVKSSESTLYRINWDDVDDCFYNVSLNDSVNKVIAKSVMDILCNHENWFDSLDESKLKYDKTDIVDSICTDKFRLIKDRDLTDEEYAELQHNNSDRECYRLIYIPKGCECPIILSSHSENPEPIHWLKMLWYIMKEKEHYERKRKEI